MCETCESIIRRAYGELRARGASRFDALEAAARVYGFHHPGTELAAARLRVAEIVGEPGG